MALTTIIMLALALGGADRSDPHPVTEAEQACAIAKTSLARRRDAPESVIALCDVIPADEAPGGYFVMALHSSRQCDGICSTNMGWFAVEKAIGDVFEWDVADWKLGPPAEPADVRRPP